MTNFVTQFDSKWLRWQDLPDGEATATITSAEKEPVEMPPVGKEEEKFVLRFAKTKKGLICNRTNATTISTIHGTEIEDWIGKKVTLYADLGVKFRGEKVGGIRVRPK